jgi:reductive dehalogenase
MTIPGKEGFGYMLLCLLLVAVLGVFCAFLFFLIESLKEHEQHAARIGILGVSISPALAALVIFLPFSRIPFAVTAFLIGLTGLLFLIPSKPDRKALLGCRGHVVSAVVRPDQRDTVFARLRSLPQDSEYYKRYYAEHPEKEEKDLRRREKGLMGKKPGAIDSGYQPNMAMVWSSFDIPHFLGVHSYSDPQPNVPKSGMDPEHAARIVKGLAKHLGAVLVGVCKIDPLWVYSKRGEVFYGNWQDWGKEINPDELPPFAVVFAVEMSSASVGTAPHTPSVTESALNYAKGAYISTMLARWFSHMGFRATSEHTRNYDMVLPAMAVDAGLGEVGRLGYLIGPKYGARLRLFATLTDMPLALDKPISIGVDKFCERCKKCAECCPSRSIPMDGKVVHNGALKWKLHEESCFEYWSKVGTDCCICMAICPFSRPDTLFHNAIRWFVARSRLAQIVFPSIDNFLYGKKWRPKPAPDWLVYPKSGQANKDVSLLSKIN